MIIYHIYFFIMKTHIFMLNTAFKIYKIGELGKIKVDFVIIKES